MRHSEGERLRKGEPAQKAEFGEQPNLAAEQPDGRVPESRKRKRSAKSSGQTDIYDRPKSALKSACARRLDPPFLNKSA